MTIPASITHPPLLTAQIPATAAQAALTAISGFASTDALRYVVGGWVTNREAAGGDTLELSLDGSTLTTIPPGDSLLLSQLIPEGYVIATGVGGNRSLMIKQGTGAGDYEAVISYLAPLVA